MVVVPTSHDVTLSYGRSAANDLGDVATLAGVVLLVALFVVPPVRRRLRPGSDREPPAEEPAAPALEV